MQTGLLPDAELLQGLINGSEAAYEALVDAFQEKVLNTCLGFLPNVQDAEDATQDVFLEVFRSVTKFNGESRLSTWIYRIAVSKCLETLRNRKRHKRMAFFQALIGLDDARAAAVPDALFHPGIQLENRERARILYGAMDRLPDTQRAAFVLHKVEGLSHREIGEALGLNVPAVEALIFRAKQNLRKRLTNYYQHDD